MQLVMLAIAALLAWLAWRVWRARRKPAPRRRPMVTAGHGRASSSHDPHARTSYESAGAVADHGGSTRYESFSDDSCSRDASSSSSESSSSDSSCSSDSSSSSSSD